VNKYQRKSERVVYENSRIQVFDDEVTTPAGFPDTYFRFKFKGDSRGVVVVPRTTDGLYLLIRVHRYAFDDVSLEFPRGGMLPSEEAREAAARELFEETGLRARQLSHLGVLRPDTSIAELEAHVFFAEIPVEAQNNFAPDCGEAILGPTFLTHDELLIRVREGGILDAYTLAAITLVTVSEIGGQI
jgi:8-oxo-dGTP pyrophosphatase MutT (NUDIX family)